jgi:transposase
VIKKGDCYIFTQLLSPAPQELEIEKVEIVRGSLEIKVGAVSEGGSCPNCQRFSKRRHSYYWRQLDDLPVSGQAVVLRWRVCRYFCDNSGCPKRTFAHRLPQVALPYAHRTQRQLQLLTQLGLALGGKPGERLADLLAVKVSGKTLLRAVRRFGQLQVTNITSETTALQVRVLGVDDFAWQRGTRYGTILVDLEHHRPLDLLPDRSADSLANWLEKHPEVAIVSRDRSGIYAEGANRGAPQAIQVADRFHLVQNLGAALESLLERLGVWKLALPLPLPLPTPVGMTESKAPKATATKPKPVNIQEARKAASRERRIVQYEQVLALYQQGWTRQRIAKRLKLTLTTVRRYLRAEQFPERTYHPRLSQLEPHKQYLQKRWEEGQHNAHHLWIEITQRGFEGSVDLVRRFVRHWRVETQARTRAADHQFSVRHLSVRGAAKLLVSDPAKLSEKATNDLRRLREWDAQVDKAYRLTQSFKALVRQRPGQIGLEEWLKAVDLSEVAELIRFGKGLRKDYEAVVAGLTLPYSNAQVEGQVNRLKLIKRSMFGRANFDLLRTRVLAA